MAATHALLTAACEAGDHVVLPADLYGGTYRLVDKVLTRWGLRYTMVDQTDLDAARRARCADDTRLIWVETPTNPLLNVVDVAGVVARKRNALVAVDNTFATPVNQRPLEDGADAVVHSTTKYLGGHSDVDRRRRRSCATPTCTSRCASCRSRSAPCPGPSTASSCTAGCARWPCACARTPRARRAVVASGCAAPTAPTTCAGRASAAWSPSATPTPSPSPRRTKLFTLAESLGGVESLIEVPQAMTHQTVEGSAAAVPADLVRLSCGIEAPEDLVADLAAAFARVAERAAALRA